jgi:hypothetical protein
MRLPRKWLLLLSGIIFLICVAIASTNAISISASFNRATDPFSITSSGGAGGANERIDSVFDFTKDKQKYDDFLSALSRHNITSATATFTLEFTNNGLDSDGTNFVIPGFWNVNFNNILAEPSLAGGAMPTTPGVKGTFTINLFDPRLYTYKGTLHPNPKPTQLTNLFTGDRKGVVPWFWTDDVIVYFAKLEFGIENDTKVPKPSSLLGVLAFGALAVGLLLKSKQKSATRTKLRY